MLTIYRRHTTSCEHYGKSRNAARTRNCRCPIWVQGSLAGERVRESLDLSSWAAASDLIHHWEAVGKVHAEKPVDKEPVKIRTAVTKYLEDAKARNLKESSLTKFREVIERRFLEFCLLRRLRLITEVDVEAIRDFRSTWKYSPVTAQKRLEHLRAFFRFCVDSGWIEKNPASSVKAGKVTHVPKQPFSDAEMAKILKTCEKLPAHGKWGMGRSQRALAMALLLRCSGLRISDASTLERSQLKDGKIFLYTQKTGIPVTVPVPPKVTKALRDCPNENDRYFFWSGKGKRTTVVNIWQEAMARVFKLAGIPKAHIHRFRHTFAVNLLQRGVPIDVVSVLLGHSSIKITEKHYAPWVQARQDRLESLVRKSW